jgi:hypothetical protein
MWHKVPSAVWTESPSGTSLEEANSEWSDVTWKEAPEWRTQDDDKVVADEVAAATEPLGADPVPRPRAAWRAQNSANFAGNFSKQFSEWWVVFL